MVSSLVLLLMLTVDPSYAKKSSSFTKKKINSSSLNSIKSNNFKVSALIDKSITLTCSIELDNKNFSKSGNYKVAHKILLEN